MKRERDIRTHIQKTHRHTHRDRHTHTETHTETDRHTERGRTTPDQVLIPPDA